MVRVRALLMARGAATVSAALALVVLIGWWLGLPTLTSVLREWPASSAVTALMVFLCAGSLAIHASRPAREPWRIAAHVLAATAGIIAALTMVEYLFDADLGLDRVALLGDVHPRMSGYFTRPALPTALGFFAVSSALLLVDQSGPRGFRPADALALAAGSVAMIWLFGYLFGLHELYSMRRGAYPLMGMSMITALILAVLSVGVLAVRPGLGLASIVTSEQAGGIAARRLLAGLAALIPVAVALELAARLSLLPILLADALVVFTGLVFGLASIVMTARSLNRTSAALASALDEATRWKDVFERAAWGAALRSPNGTIVAANSVLARLHGYTAREIVGRPGAELVAPGAREDVERALASIGPGEQRTLRSEQVRKDGSTFPAIVDASGVFDEDGELRCHAVFVRDVSELERAEEARARLASIVESTDDVITAADLQGNVIAWNPAAERMLGYTAEEMIGRPIWTIVPEERAAETRARFERLCRGEHAAPFVTERVRKDGTRARISLTLSPIVDRDGTVIGVSAVGHDIEARLAIEEALRRSEQRYRSLVEQAPIGILLADLGARYTDVNEAGARMLGYTKDEIVGMTVFDLIRPEDRQRFLESRERQFSGSIDIQEFELRKKDGSLLPVEVRARVLPDGRWQAVVSDMSERRRAEETLRRAHRTELALRRELEQVLSASGEVADALAAVPENSVELALETIAREARSLTGATQAIVCVPREGVSEREACVVVEGQVETDTSWMHGLLSGLRLREPLRVEDTRADERFRRLTEGPTPMECALVVPIRFRDRDVGCICLTAARAGGLDEVDERVMRIFAARTGAVIEIARLYEREALQRTWLEVVLEQMPEGVVITDREGKVLRKSEAAHALVGARVGRPFVSGLRAPSGETIGRSEQPLRRALERGEVTAGKELAVLTPEGELVPVLVSAKPIRGPRGATGAMMVLQDIRVMKELERLRQEWSSVVAHDLRQPVSVIALAAQLLQMHTGGLDPRDEKAVARIRSATQRLDRMIGDLLDVSRLDARRLPLERRVVDVGHLVARVIDENEAVLRGFSVERRIEPSLLADVDPDRIQQVLVNLLTNAAKYGEPESAIRVEAHRERDRVRISVTNRGPGIPADRIPTLFARFSRTREARAAGKPGIGLGLYIAKGLVEAHGGRIGVESTPGETTTFYFTLPAHAAEAQLASQPEG